MHLRLALLVLLLAVAPASAVALDVVVGPTNLDVATLAEELELPGTPEAAVLVVAGLGLDALEVGFDVVPLASLPGIAKNPPLLLRGLEEGLIGVSLRRGDLAWEGQLRLFAGRITRLDADEVLRAEARRDERVAPAAPSFDLFGFYDALDERPGWDARIALCDATLAGLDAEGPDHRLVSQSCAKVAADKARFDAEEQRELVGADALALGGEQDDGKPVSVELIYRRDGRPRVNARGTGIRWAITGGGVLGAGILTYSAVFWESQAQTEYLAYRRAERLGDSLAMSRHLHFTRSFDGRRDGSIAAASLLFTGALSAVIVQAVEGARFRKARARLLGEAG